MLVVCCCCTCYCASKGAAPVALDTTTDTGLDQTEKGIAAEVAIFRQKISVSTHAKGDGKPAADALLTEEKAAPETKRAADEKIAEEAKHVANSEIPNIVEMELCVQMDELPEMSGVDVSEVIPVSELEFAQLEADSLRAQLAETQASVCKSNLALHLALEEAEEVRRRERYLVLRDEQLRGEVAALKSYLGKRNDEALALSLQRAHELATANCKVEVERRESVTGLAKVSHELEAASKAAKMYLGLLQQTRAQLTEALRTRQEAITHANHRAEAEMAARHIQSEQNRVLEEAHAQRTEERDRLTLALDKQAAECSGIRDENARLLRSIVGFEALVIQLTQDAQNQAQAHSAIQLQMQADYNQKIYLLDSQHKELTLAYDTLTSTHKCTRVTLGQLQTSQTSLMAKLDELKSKNQELEARVQSMMAGGEESARHLSNQLALSESKCNNLTLHLEKSQEAFATTSEQLQELQESASVSRQREADLLSDKQALAQKADELRAELDFTRAKVGAELQITRHEVAEKQAELEMIKVTSEAKHARLLKLTSELEQNFEHERGLRTSLQSEVARLSELPSIVQKHEKTIVQLKAELAMSASEVQQELSETQRELESQQSNFNVLQGDYKHTLDEMSQLEVDLEIEREMKDALASKCNQWEGKASQLLLQCKQLSDSLLEANQLLASNATAASIRDSALTQALAAAREKNSESHAALVHLQKFCGELTVERDELASRIRLWTLEKEHAAFSQQGELDRLMAELQKASVLEAQMQVKLSKFHIDTQAYVDAVDEPSVSEKAAAKQTPSSPLKDRIERVPNPAALDNLLRVNVGVRDADFDRDVALRRARQHNIDRLLGISPASSHDSCPSASINPQSPNNLLIAPPGNATQSKEPNSYSTYLPLTQLNQNILQLSKSNGPGERYHDVDRPPITPWNGRDQVAVGHRVGSSGARSPEFANKQIGPQSLAALHGNTARSTTSPTTTSITSSRFGFTSSTYY
jgi:hypothetical protein